MNTNFDYGRMACDPIRSQAYIQAIRSAVRANDTVLDLGCGSGIFSVLAAKLGAKKVIAIDPNPAIHLGPLIAKRNGVAEKIQFIHGVSTDLKLEEPVDCIFSDLRGALPLYKMHLPAIKDATERLLKHDGALIPVEDRLYAAPVRDDKVEHMLTTPWLENSLDLDLSPIGHIERNRRWRARISATQLCARPKLWCKIKYREINELSFRKELQWRFNSPGTMTGVALWFDSNLYDDVELSNHPAQPSVIYGQTLFPVETIDYLPNQKLSVVLEAKFWRRSYIWSWQISLNSAEGKKIHRVQHSSVTQNYVNKSVVHL